MFGNAGSRAGHRQWDRVGKFLTWMGSVGIGVKKPLAPLHVIDDGGNGILLEAIKGTLRKWNLLIGAGAFQIYDQTAGAVRVSIDTNGSAVVNNNLQVGNALTSKILTVSGGASANGYGAQFAARADGNLIYALGNESSISGGSYSSEPTIYCNGAGKFRIWAVGSVCPHDDVSVNLGDGSYRWATVYAATGAINTSDRRAKTDEHEIGAQDAVDFVKAVPAKFFRRLDGKHVVDKNEPLVDPETGAQIGVDYESHIEPGTRTHAGWIAQDVQAALSAIGKDPGQMAVWGLVDPADPDSTQQIRPDQMTAFLWAALQNALERIEALEAAQ